MMLRAAAMLLLLLSAASAHAADLSINAFAGKWQGSAVAESDISANFRLTSRDIDVEVRPSGEGFAITWNTLQRQKGDPERPIEVLKSTTISFVPARPGIWRAEDAGDPVTSDRPYAWAFVDDKTLVIKSLRIYPEGRHEIQIYRRTLSGTGMVLEFVRVVDGEPARRASGRLVKVAK